MERNDNSLDRIYALVLSSLRKKRLTFHAHNMRIFRISADNGTENEKRPRMVPSLIAAIAKQWPVAEVLDDEMLRGL